MDSYLCRHMFSYVSYFMLHVSYKKEKSRTGIAKSYTKFVCHTQIFNNKKLSNCFPKWLYYFLFSSAVCERFRCFTSLLSLGIFSLFFFFGCTGSSLLCTGFLQLRCKGFSLPGLLLLLLLEHRLQGTWASVVAAHRLQSPGSLVVACGISCPATCGIFPDEGLNPCPLHCKADS